MNGTKRTSIPPPRRFAALLAFMRGEAAAGAALIIAAAAALGWSNGPYAGSYFALLNLPVGLGVGAWTWALPLDQWVNEGLMALFFLTVSLEIRREMTEGQLASLHKLAAPGLAALGGMVVPALVYAGLNWHDSATLGGWAVPVATDIAFALAALAVLGRWVPVGLKVFLTALAIVDDLGAIMVIALFYSVHPRIPALLGGALILVALHGLNRAGVKALGPYMLGGGALWGCLLYSGVHPTLAGVGLAFVVPASDGRDSPAHRLARGLSGWVSWVVLPLFGLANAGVRLGGMTVSDLGSPVMLGTILGLVAGKQVGVFGTTLLAVRLGLARLPRGLTMPRLYGVALLCGIGFTMSLFIGDLSFHRNAIHTQVKVAIFIGSLLSAALGMLVLAIGRPKRTPARGLGSA